MEDEQMKFGAKKYLMGKSICIACGHPERYHDERGFCYICTASTVKFEFSGCSR